MAEFMDVPSNSNNDREVDRMSFLKAQFDIFTHKYRDMFDDEGNERASNVSLDPTIKKDVANMVRRIQKNRIWMQSLGETDTTVIKPIITKLNEIEEKLMFFLKDTTDFSPKNITLPECDMDDIDLLIGSDNISDELTDPIDRVRRTNEAIKLNINENLGEAEIILNEVEEIRRILMTAKP